jgi:dTDP-4-dehydrorhamnose reductase
MERVLVLGAMGMVGAALMRVLTAGFDPIGLGHESLDITAEVETLRTLQEIRPRIVVHAAAYTDVDGCETDPERAFRVNSQGTLHVARACHQVGAKLVYISTDYVFDGERSKPYREDAPTNPISVYGRSKLEGESQVRRLLKEFIIVRSQWLFGKGGKNFVTTILGLARQGNRLTIVQDQVGSPTYVVDLAWAIFRLLEKGSQGIFHVANSSHCSWYELAQEIVRTAGILDCEITPVDAAFLGRPAPRPRYSVLDCERLNLETGMRMRPWQEALREFLKGRGES